MTPPSPVARFSWSVIVAGTADVGDGAGEDIADTIAATDTAASIGRIIARCTARITVLASDMGIGAGRLRGRGRAGNSGVRSLISQSVCTLEFCGIRSVPFWA